MAVDFTKMSDKIHKAFDTDYMDIYRQVEGSPQRDLLYDNVSCHIVIKSSDNPDPTSVDVQPIIKSIVVHMNNTVDVQNNDYIIAKKTDTKGKVLHYYCGTIGYPSVSMARKSVNMAMNTLKEFEPTTPNPIPEAEATEVIVSFIDNETKEEIKNKIVQKFKIGSKAVIQPDEIENYEVNYAELNGIIQQSITVEINNIKKQNYQVDYYYNPTTNLVYIRPLVNGIYTKDNGKLASGLYYYKKMPIISIINQSTIEIEKISLINEEDETIELKKGSVFIDNIGNCHELTDNPVKTNNGWSIEYKDIAHVEAEITHWYD